MNTTSPDPASSQHLKSSDPASALSGQGTLVDQLVQWAELRMSQQVFRPGMRMPSVRQLATERGVSRFTVVEAYERLVARGRLQARRGAGFFVREPEQAASPKRARATPARVQPIDMGWLVRNMQSGIAADKAPGFGYLPPDLCGGELIKGGLRSVAATAGLQLSHAALAQGYAPLREQIVRRLAELEISASPAQILTTSGATQAVDLIARKFLRPGDSVIVGNPAWSAQLGTLSMMGVNLVSLPYTPQGPDVAALAELAASCQPKMLLLNTVLHNPTGLLLTPAAAYQILRVAEAHDLIVVEDDIYADFLPSGIPTARLASLDQLKRVIYLGSFSKMLVPNVRVGYLAASAEIAETLGNQKLLTSLATPEINERIVHRALTEGSYRKHCQRVHAALDELREPTFARLESLGLTPYCRPQAGFHGWFDTGVDTIALAALALEAGYLLAPGALFSPQQSPSTFMRMNIATSQNPAVLKWLETTLNQLRR
ncbi:PLP-dependent aminotransferase family protein [Rhodoferax fermentans]|uniref:aminotransferase-like domain-containing protein n=1 Tax=Rhodoferax fermentans TaxID=28066 RepID=UPI000993787E|nr:PLP-dependent aminotransferase family protein [Rhodoferax fermentans]MBK1685261.1 PLP-dependent aminotransferase family protein [Rhodoferax fermentans]